MKLALVGKGNVGHHLYHYFLEEGKDVVWVDSRAAQIPKADIVVLCIPDKAIAPWFEGRDLDAECCYCHTSGATSLADIPSENKGVIYPLQTFSKDKEMEYKTIPFYLEFANAKSEALIQNWFKDLANTTQVLSSHERLKLHVAAVFACNFLQAQLRMSEQLLQEVNLSKNDLRHLVAESVEKFYVMDGARGQTGPAHRGDTTTLEKHREILSKNRELSEVYHLISDWIINHNHAQ